MFHVFANFNGFVKQKVPIFGTKEDWKNTPRVCTIASKKKSYFIATQKIPHSEIQAHLQS
jgi:hypothetical protein